MDTDGWCEKTGSVQFGTSSERLAQDFAELVRSLGGTCFTRSRMPHYTYRGARLPGLRSYSATICHLDGDAPFTLPRKAARLKPGRRQYPLTVLSVEALGRSETQCISVSHPSRLYVTDQHIVTHNTTLALELFATIGLHGQGSLFFSLDMKKESLGARMQSACTARRDLSDGVPLSTIINHAKPHVPVYLNRDQLDHLEAATLLLSSYPLHINDQTDLSVREVKALTRKAIRAHGISSIFVDHLGKLNHVAGENQNVRVGYTVKALKNLARELGVVVFALAQLNRDNAKRGKDGLRPMLSDLRESGDIEQEADAVLLLHRQDYYDRQRAGGRDDGEGGMEVNVAKSRNDAVGVINMKTSLRVCRVWEPDDHYPEDAPEAGPRDEYADERLDEYE